VTISLDTNVLVYAANVDDPERHPVARDVIRRATETDCVLTLQSLAEFVRVMTGKARMPYAETRRFVDDWRRIFRVQAADEDAFDMALDAAAAHRLPIFDAMLWATARRAGCTVLISEDFQDGRSLGGVTFLNPFEPKNARRLDRLLPKL
jgi:predicted nucleic acid-binding protein